jgi:hypothetical protein
MDNRNDGFYKHLVDWKVAAVERYTLGVGLKTVTALPIHGINLRA